VGYQGGVRSAALFIIQEIVSVIAMTNSPACTNAPIGEGKRVGTDELRRFELKPT
jgi:hypothetical protein